MKPAAGAGITKVTKTPKSVQKEIETTGMRLCDLYFVFLMIRACYRVRLRRR